MNIDNGINGIWKKSCGQIQIEPQTRKNNVDNLMETLTMIRVMWHTWIMIYVSHRNDGVDFWKRIIYVDEKTFRSDQRGKLHIWRRNGTAMDPRHLNEVHSSGHVTVNLFGWVWGHDVGEQTRVRDRFTGKYTSHYSLSWQLIQLFGDYLIYLMDFGTRRRPIRWNFGGCSPHCQGNGASFSGAGHSASGQ